ncbi:hypothetical protein Agub_g5509 [Astrephomene gubernaculifera]|uniref:Uncharacterized protein n=1 Tax=Astrephomene gubernaculifera TaxID=47775 RepID=A0AAD3DP22_9CHLO|nr:hypothetical protein Agub_g5509 [Astrephomene gubernaculifera]
MAASLAQTIAQQRSIGGSHYLVHGSNDLQEAPSLGPRNEPQLRVGSSVHACLVESSSLCNESTVNLGPLPSQQPNNDRVPCSCAGDAALLPDSLPSHLCRCNSGNHVNPSRSETSGLAPGSEGSGADVRLAAAAGAAWEQQQRQDAGRAGAAAAEGGRQQRFQDGERPSQRSTADRAAGESTAVLGPAAAAGAAAGTSSGEVGSRGRCPGIARHGATEGAESAWMREDKQQVQLQPLRRQQRQQQQQLEGGCGATNGDALPANGMPAAPMGLDLPSRNPSSSSQQQQHHHYHRHHHASLQANQQQEVEQQRHHQQQQQQQLGRRQTEPQQQRHDESGAQPAAPIAHPHPDTSNRNQTQVSSGRRRDGAGSTATASSIGSNGNSNSRSRSRAGSSISSRHSSGRSLLVASRTDLSSAPGSQTFQSPKLTEAGGSSCSNSVMPQGAPSSLLTASSTTITTVAGNTVSAVDIMLNTATTTAATTANSATTATTTPTACITSGHGDSGFNSTTSSFQGAAAAAAATAANNPLVAATTDLRTARSLPARLQIASKSDSSALESISAAAAAGVAIAPSANRFPLRAPGIFSSKSAGSALTTAPGGSGGSGIGLGGGLTAATSAAAALHGGAAGGGGGGLFNRTSLSTTPSPSTASPVYENEPALRMISCTLRASNISRPPGSRARGRVCTPEELSKKLLAESGGAATKVLLTRAAGGLADLPPPPPKAPWGSFPPIAEDEAAQQQQQQQLHGGGYGGGEGAGHGEGVLLRRVKTCGCVIS